MFWKIQRKNDATGKWIDTLSNANITSIKAFDEGLPSARVYIEGHRYDNHGDPKTHRVVLTEDIVRRAAIKLGLVKAGE